MISLFLDTCYYNLIIAIYKDNEQLYFKVEKGDNSLSQKLLPYIKEAFDSIKMSINKIDRIYVANGPGSFTGIRIGVDVAKVLAYTLKKQINTISELEILASTDVDKKYIVPIIDARRGYVYGGVYDCNGANIIEDTYILFDNLLRKINDDYIIVSYDNLVASVIEPNINISKIINNHKNDVSINCHSVNPNYLKKTEAEEKNDQNSQL